MEAIRVATRVATPVDVCGRSNTIQHDDLAGSNTQLYGMDARGRIETKVARTSKPQLGILGDVGGRIVPVAPRPAFEYDLIAARQVSPSLTSSLRSVDILFADT